MKTNLPLVLYGAGARAEYEKQLLEHSGLNPVCFVDADVNKQSSQYLGLPVISLEQAIKDYGEFDVHITPWELRGEVFEFLLSCGIPEERILNSPTEQCMGCMDLDGKLNAANTCLFTCCKTNSTMQEPPAIWWESCGEDMEATVLSYISMRDKLISAIKNGETCQCTGCSMIRSEYRPIKKTIKTLCLSLDNSCQISCIYCCNDNDPSRFQIMDRHRRFAREFDYRQFIEILEKHGYLSFDTTIALTAGEITINPRMDDILDAAQNYKLYVYTNGLIYNERIAKLAARPGSGMNISVDAGTSEDYKIIKGADAFDKVWENIKRYSENGVRIDVKYIFLDENINETNVNGFIKEAVKSGLSGVIHISRDQYRKNPFTREQMDLIVKLAHMAEQNGLQWYIVPTFTQNEQEEILRLKAELF